MKLRDYQEAAVCSVYEYFSTHVTGNPCVVIPTGGGKTPVLAAICHDVQSAWGGRVLVLSHVKELLDQSAHTLLRTDPTLDVGVYSAGLGRRDTRNQIICAGIQSVYQKSDDLGAFDLIIVDEAHLIPADGVGRYQTFLKDQMELNPFLRIVGLTATPYRLDVGEICGPDAVLTEVCYEASVKDLITAGWLSPLKARQGTHRVDFEKVKLTGGEFNAAALTSTMTQGDTVSRACSDIVEKTQDRKSVLVFACSVEHAEQVQAALQRISKEEVGLVTGATEASERAELLMRFRGESITTSLFGDQKKPLKYLVNVNVLTTGFDAPNIDAIALLRPTMSPGLYVQMVGRGLRKCAGKADCLVLDYGNNVLRHGCIDMITVAEKSKSKGAPPLKACPKCGAFVPIGCTECDCGHAFQRSEKKGPDHDEKSGTNGLISGEVTFLTLPVRGTEYHFHEKRKEPGDLRYYPPTMEVVYKTDLLTHYKEWLCVQHLNRWARKRFEKWWADRSTDPAPATVVDALACAQAGGLGETKEIRVKITAGKKYPEVVSSVARETRCMQDTKPYPEDF